MHIKRFTGSTVKEAIKAIKAEFGENALVLSTKRLGKGLHEVVAAIDYDLSSPIDLDIEADRRLKTATAGAAKGSRARDGVDPVVRRDIKELKDLCWTMINQGRGPVSGALAKLEAEFVANGVDKRLARNVLAGTFKGAKAGDISAMKSLLRKRIYDRISVSDPLAQKGNVMFIGPTGVGKTTTIAKLAAIHALKKKRKVALLTMDTYRIAAAEQLKVYGKIIGLPVEVARNAGELSVLLKTHSDKDHVFIDTAGRSRKNAEHLRVLRSVAEVDPGIRFNLVLSVLTRDEGLYRCINGFKSLPIDSLTFTKLDEASVFGPILNSMVMSGRPVAYLTTGQRVPEDIELATRENVLNYVMPK